MAVSIIDGQRGYSHRYIRDGESAEYFYPVSRAKWVAEHRKETLLINRKLKCFWSKAHRLALPIVEKKLGPCPDTIITIWEE
jgi:hypothetical protein